MLVVPSRAVVLGWAGAGRVLGDGTCLPGGFGAIRGCELQADRLTLSQSLVGIRAETICLHTCAHRNTHACACAHSVHQPRDGI